MDCMFKVVCLFYVLILAEGGQTAGGSLGMAPYSFTSFALPSRSPCGRHLAGQRNGEYCMETLWCHGYSISALKLSFPRTMACSHVQAASFYDLVFGPVSILVFAFLSSLGILTASLSTAWI
ncbi:hypothetical protein DL98DRAFT_37655 [Cadophora sp. DSE1049]|nr:hypothetical protein DL98DRAFT_37655 [Cadophora sp. DSE1049]